MLKFQVPDEPGLYRWRNLGTKPFWVVTRLKVLFVIRPGRQMYVWVKDKNERDFLCFSNVGEPLPGCDEEEVA